MIAEDRDEHGVTGTEQNSLPSGNKGKSWLQGSPRPAGLHLFNRATGSNILIDEIVPPPASWSLAPRHVSVALTNACDLSCPHCYAPKNFAALDLSKLVRWLIELDANGCLGVGFGGGEPTLYPELCELSSFVEQKTNRP